MQEKLQFPKEGVYMYIVKGRDEYLYIGLSGDLSARLEAIERGEGPESLKRKTPVELVYVRRYPSFADAREISKRLKVYTRERKEWLIHAYQHAWQQTTEKTAETAYQIGENIGFPPAKTKQANDV